MDNINIEFINEFNKNFDIIKNNIFQIKYNLIKNEEWGKLDENLKKFYKEL